MVRRFPKTTAALVLYLAVLTYVSASLFWMLRETNDGLGGMLQVLLTVPVGFFVLVLGPRGQGGVVTVFVAGVLQALVIYVCIVTYMKRHPHEASGGVAR